MPITQLLIAARTQLTEVLFSDNTVAMLTLNKWGRLRVSTKHGEFPVITGNLAAVNDQVTSDVSEAASVIVTLKNTGTAALNTGLFTFEGSINSTNGTDGDWVQLQGARSNQNVQDYSYAAGGIAAATLLGYSWRFAVNGYHWFRVRCTSAATASSIATFGIGRDVGASDANPVIPTHAVTQSGGPWTVSQNGTVTTAPNSSSASPYILLSTAVAVAALIKNAAGAITELTAFNNTAATVYIKLYNKASAPVPASDVPVDTIPLAAGAHLALEFGSLGKRFATGIALGVTGSATVNDTTAIAAGLQVSATYI